MAVSVSFAIGTASALTSLPGAGTRLLRVRCDVKKRPYVRLIELGADRQPYRVMRPRLARSFKWNARPVDP
jgi:hypothetical protein